MYRAELSLEDQTYGVITCEYVLCQKTDDTGRPTGKVRSGLIQVTLETGEDELLVNWAADSNKQLDGYLYFYSLEKDGALFKEVRFEGAFCVGYRDYFLPLDNNVFSLQLPAQAATYCTEIAISAAKLTLDGTIHDNGWPI